MDNENAQPVEQREKQTYPLLSDKAYAHLKRFVTILLPGFGALYFGLAEIWSLPKGAEVVGTVTVLATFLGLVLKAAEATYDKSGTKFDGAMEVFVDEDGAKKLSLQLDGDPYELDKKDVVSFRVKST